MPEAHEPVPESNALNEDEGRLAKLGYKQELNRTWSGFSNFAISFSIISILAGCFTTFGQGCNNGGPVAISWGWPIVSVFILIIGFTHVRAGVGLPDLGRHLLVGVEDGRPEGRLLHGLAEPDRPGRGTASVAYGCATFIDLTLSTLQRVLRRRLLAQARVPRDLPRAAGDRPDAEHLQRVT